MDYRIYIFIQIGTEAQVHLFDPELVLQSVWVSSGFFSVFLSPSQTHAHRLKHFTDEDDEKCFYIYSVFWIFDTPGRNWSSLKTSD